jgi:hypothetical protein
MWLSPALSITWIKPVVTLNLFPIAWLATLVAACILAPKERR